MTPRIITDSALNIPREVAQADSTLGTPLLLRGTHPLSLRGTPVPKQSHPVFLGRLSKNRHRAETIHRTPVTKKAKL